MARHTQGSEWSENKKIEVVTTYLVLGKSNLVAAATGVPEGTIRYWKTEPWWKELVDQIQHEDDVELDAKLKKRIDKALDLVNDRLENGDFLYDPKTGEFVRKPVGVRDGWKVASEMIDKQNLLRKKPKDSVSQEGVAEILKNLAAEFAGMARKKMKEVSDGTEPSETELRQGVQELPRNTGTDPQPESTEPSTPSVRESER